MQAHSSLDSRPKRSRDPLGAEPVGQPSGRSAAYVGDDGVPQRVVPVQARVIRVLELDRLTRRFDQVVALDELSFAVPSGAIWGFVGRNGAGKTTAMRIILGLLSVDGGEVRWDGAPMDTALRRSTGYMPEERGLYPKMRVADQLAYFGSLHGLPDDEARAAADRWVGRLGLAERHGERLEKLSLGNQQRVQLAVALVHEPRLLVLDEPFSGLDPVAVDVLTGVLRERAAEGVTVLFSSHQLELVERVCDGVAIIDAGRLVAAGTVDGLASAGPPGLRIRVDGALDWSAAPGVVSATPDGDATVLSLAPDADDQQILAYAQHAGAVREFTPQRHSIAEIFAEAIRDSP